MSLFFHEFQQNSQFLRTISLSNESDLGRVAYRKSDTKNSWKMKTVQRRNTDEEKDRSHCRLQQWRWWILMDINPNTHEKDMYRIMSGV